MCIFALSKDDNNGTTLNLYTMTLYNIIATSHIHTERGSHSMVLHHSIKKTIDSAIRWIKLMAETHSYETPTKTYEDDRFVCYTAKVTTPSGLNGWVEFEIWKEEIE